jgi:diguanylate cyclase (GGDEF)-like protein/PAS domain S-box-containing protein
MCHDMTRVGGTDPLVSRERLATSERLARARFDQSAMPQAMLGLDGTITVVNDALCRLVGRPRKQLVGSSTTSLHHPSDPAAGILRGEDVLAGRVDASSWERIFTSPDGDPLPVLVHASLIRDADRAPAEIFCIIQDLSVLRDAQYALDRVTARFEALIDDAADWAAIVDPDGRMLYASPAVHLALGLDERGVEGRIGFEFVHPDDHDAAREALARVAARPRRAESVVGRVLTADGGCVWVEETLTNRLDDPHIRGIVCTGRDVTERVMAERALRASEERFRSIVETAQEGIWAVNAAGRTVFANEKLAQILGVPLNHVYATAAADVLVGRDPDSVAERIRRRGEVGPESYEMVYDHPDGRARVLHINATPLNEPRTVGSLATIMDVTDMRRVEDELRRRVVHDELTGLPNRTLLMDRLEQALARVARNPQQAVAVLFVDLDHFKLVNDSWGHATGDALLRQVGERLQSAVRPGDTVARFGGDEFVVVCEVADHDEAERIARGIIVSLDARFDVDGQSMYAGASVGIAVSPPSAAGELLRFADVAMYDAKGRGRGRVQRFDVALAERSAERLILGNDLRDALEQGALDMYYQPIVNLETGEVVTVEALARWRHHVRGLVPAAQFVGIAETAGMGPALDRWALATGVRDARTLRERLSSRVRVAVNVSAANLADPTLERNLMSTLAALEVPRDLLVLEITESALMEHPEHARDTIHRLAERGIGTAIDDFGTGYSSLAYLNQLPVQTLKIDRSFVAGIAEDEDAFAIVAAIVDLARILRVRTVAEGVETREQLGLLQRLGCWAGQGYLWSRPLPLEDAITAMASRRGERFDVSGDPRAAPSARRRKDSVTTDHGLAQILRLHRQGASLSTIAAALNAEGFRTPQGTRWHRTRVARVIQDVAFPGLLDAGGEDNPPR